MIPVAIACALLALVLFVTRPRRVAAVLPRPDAAVAPTGQPAPSAPESSGVHLWVATPAYGDKLSGCAADSLRELDALCRMSGVKLTVARGSQSLLPKLRSEMAHSFLTSTQEPRPTHFMFCDSDIGYRGEDVLRAITTEHPVVGLPCAKRDLDFVKMAAWARTHDTSTPEGMSAFIRAGIQWCFVGLDGEGSNEVVRDCFRVARIGTGILIVRRDVLEVVAAASKDKYVLRETDEASMSGVFECGRRPREGKPSVYVAEDYAFSERVRKAGFDVWAYLPARTWHHGVEMTIDACLLDWMQADGEAKEAA